MERRKFTREFKLEAVRLIKDRGVSYVQASQDLGVHLSQLRDWVKKFADDPQHAFPGHGLDEARAGRDRAAQARSHQAEGRAGHPKKSRGLLREGSDVKFSFIAKHRGIWPADWLCGALGVSRGGFYAWLTDRAVSAAAAMRTSAQGFAPASWRAIGPMARGGCGTTCWPKGCRAACTGSSD